MLPNRDGFSLLEELVSELLLTRRESQHLRRTLWNNLTEAVNDAVEPLSAERR